MKLKDMLNAISSRPLKAENVIMSPDLYNELRYGAECRRCRSDKEAHMPDGTCLFLPGSTYAAYTEDILAGKMANDIAVEEDERFLALMLNATKRAKKGAKK